MKTIKIILIAAVNLLFLNSCEKVIDIDLEESDSQITIEAQLEEGNHLFSVFVTKTAPYFDSQKNENIEDAIVTLSDDANNVYHIPHVKNGEYSLQINTMANKTYSLQAEIDGEIYEASSYLPPKVMLNEVYFEYQQGFGHMEEGYNVYFRYNDPAGEPNFYRVIYYLNDEIQLKSENLQVLNDNLNDGNTARFPLFQKVFQPGEKVTIKLMHLDEASYDYFSSLSDIVGGQMGPNSGSAAPGNPITNWSGGILGYFCAFSSDTLSTVIQATKR